MRTNIAYDLTQFSNAPSPRPQPRVRVLKSERNKKRLARAFALRMTAYALVLLSLMSYTVYSHMELSETKADIVSCRAKLTELDSEYTYLSYQLESTVSLKNAEQYAADELGLVKLDSSQIEYVHLGSENVIVAEKTETSFASAVSYIYSAVVGFFGGQ